MRNEAIVWTCKTKKKQSIMKKIKKTLDFYLA